MLLPKIALWDKDNNKWLEETVAYPVDKPDIKAVMLFDSKDDARIYATLKYQRWYRDRHLRIKAFWYEA